ncbi:MAG: hypothetical protein ACRCZY_07855, partial [Phocaeicola sp.]
MYRATDLKTELSNLWGWRQHYDTQEFTISDSLTKSDTGRYFQDVHPLLTLDNLKSIAPDFKRIEYNPWTDKAQYRIGDRVTYNEKNYRAVSNNINTNPEYNPTAWERFDSFSEWLDEKTKGSILKAISTFWGNNMVAKTANNILESKALFNGTGRITNTIENNSNLVGFEIVPIRAKGVTLKIDKIGLQFTGQTSITLYLMHSSQSSPIKTMTFQRIKNGGMEWFDVDDVYLPYSSINNDAGGSWYLVYEQSQLGTDKAISHDKDWSKRPCYGCNIEETSAYNIWSQYLEVHPFRISEYGGGDFNDDYNDD